MKNLKSFNESFKPKFTDMDVELLKTFFHNSDYQEKYQFEEAKIFHGVSGELYRIENPLESIIKYTTYEYENIYEEGLLLWTQISPNSQEQLEEFQKDSNNFLQELIYRGFISDIHMQANGDGIILMRFKLYRKE